MTRIRLRIYQNPGAAEVILRLRRRDGGFRRIAATVDTGAQATVLPNRLLTMLDYHMSDAARFRVQQAGITGHTFEAIEASIIVSLEDEVGGQTTEVEMRAWFAETDIAVAGFTDLLDRAILHLDMPNLTGYLDFPGDN